MSREKVLAMAGVDSDLRQTIIDCLCSSLSQDQNIRIKAEDQLKVLETTEGFGGILTDIINEHVVPMEIRQLSSVILKQYVDCHWSSMTEDKFKPPEVTPVAKAYIRCNLPNGLKDDSSKIRTSVAYAMARIASYDWPDAWPELFPLLMEALHSMNANVIHGAMRVFIEFAGEISDLQIPHIAPILLPEMVKIFSQPQIYGIRTSSRAASIFSTIAGLIGLMKDFYKGVDKQNLHPFLPDFLSSCCQQLSLPDGPTSDCGHKMEILKALEVLVKNFPKKIAPCIPNILPPMWSIFTQSVDHYVQTTVNCVDLSEDPVDEDGEILSFENLVFSVFEFISALVETPKFKKTVDQSLEDILFFTMVYMQITDEQIHLWSNDPNQFVEDEDEETLSYSVRISAQYLLLTLCEKFKTAVPRLCNAVAKLKQKGDDLKAQGDVNWWKYHETCLLSLGYIEQSIVEKLESGELDRQFRDFLTSFLLESCSSGGSPFLLGQSFWTSSRLSSILSDEAIAQFLHNTVIALQEGQDSVLKVFAIKSLFGFCDYLNTSGKAALLHPHLQQISQGLLTMATHFTDSALAMTLETLNIVLKINATFTAELVLNGNLVPLANALFLKYGSDHHLCPLIEEMIGVVAAIPACLQVVQEKTMPTLLSILEAQPDKIPATIVPPAIDLITTIVRHAQPPLSEIFIKHAFPLLVKRVISSDDDAIVQNGGECIRAFVSCATQEVLSWQDASGQNGLWYIMQVTCKLLNPGSSESSALFVGKLVNTLVLKTGNLLGDNLHIILRSVLSKLQQAKTFTVTQSLLMVFIQLIRHQLEPTLELLSTVPGPTGKSALDYILTEWCAKQMSFYGSYERKVSIDALCKLLLHAIHTGDGRFEEIVVPGDDGNDGPAIITRSKAKEAQKQMTYIPVGIKLFKLLIAELTNQIEAQELENGDGESDEDDEEDWEDVDDELRSPNSMTVQQCLDEMFAPAELFDDDDAEDDDPDTKHDPINQTNLKDSLTQFIQQFAQQACFSNFAQSLGDHEKHCLVSLGLAA